jgi:hypothetical protein
MHLTCTATAVSNNGRGIVVTNVPKTTSTFTGVLFIFYTRTWLSTRETRGSNISNTGGCRPIGTVPTRALHMFGASNLNYTAFKLSFFLPTNPPNHAFSTYFGSTLSAPLALKRRCLPGINYPTHGTAATVSDALPFDCKCHRSASNNGRGIVVTNVPKTTFTFLTECFSFLY